MKISETTMFDVEAGSTFQKYLRDKKKKKKPVDSTKEIKELIKLSKDFILNMKMLKTKYDFQSIPGMTKNFLKSYINDLNKIYKRLE